MSDKDKTEAELKALKEKVKDPQIKKAIEDKMKSIHKPVYK